MLSMFAMAASRWAPSVRADGSLKFPSSAVVPSEPVGAGDGVAGALEVVLDAGAGAAGGAGVDAAAGAGVEGALAEEAPAEVAGAALGLAWHQLDHQAHWDTFGHVLSKSCRL